MQGVATTIRLVDQMTAPIMSINNAINNLIGGFQDVESASNINTASLDLMEHQVNMANFAAEQLNEMFNVVQDTINDMTQEQNEFNTSMQRGNSAADGLVGKIGAAVAAYASFRAIGNVLNLSDNMTNMTARLNMMNDGLQTTQELQDKIFLSAQRSRADYFDTANMVATLGTQAKKAFSSNDELIQFAEQLNKTFVIAGINATGIESTMYNLTQALASGVLRGQDLNAVMANAQPILANVADYMGVGVEEIRALAADGELSAEVVKNAMLAAAEETNAVFETMPKTFGQAATSIKNQALMQFQPILNRINEIANSAAFQTLADNAINAIIIVSAMVMGVFDLFSKVARFANDNWSWLAPVIFTVVGAYAALNGVMLAQNAIAMVTKGIQIAMTVAAYAHAAATGAGVSATVAATAAQWGLNTALLACPLTWILVAIIAIIGAIYLVIGIINKVAGTSISATGIIVGAFFWLGSVVANMFMNLLDLIFGFINSLVNPFINIANFIANVFNNPVTTIIYLFQGMADTVLAILQKIASALDFVFGSNMAGAIQGWRDGLKGAADAIIAEYAPDESYSKVINELDLSVANTLGWSKFNTTDAFNAGYEVGQGIDDAISNFDPASLFGSNIPTPGEYGAGGFDLSPVENSLGNIDANTKNQLNYSDEELRLWRDIAERDTINRFTTAEVNVSLGGVTNNVASNVDLDGVLDYISETVEEQLLIVAEGVHV